MTAMLGYADLMRAAPDDADLQRESANYIYHETQPVRGTQPPSAGPDGLRRR